MKWHANTEIIVKRAYQRMIILHKLYSFNVAISDLVHIYILYIRSILEHSCQVWHYSITEEEISDLERVQKIATIIILKESYVSNAQALAVLNLETLRDRRDRLCLNFAKKCLKHDKTKDMFPLKETNDYDFREKGIFEVQHANTSRLLYSSIPQLQRALNKDALK